MAHLFFLAIYIILGVLNAEAFFHQYPKLSVKEHIADDCGDPLFLTKYIESGLIEEGRKLARVPFTENLNITSYSGFFTVNETYESHQFFWYFPAMTNPKEAPVILWLQGGPGVTSLFGLFSENGPIVVKNNNFEKRETHWALKHHVIYIDNPVGAGFSFTKDDAGYCKDQQQVGTQLYASMIQFFQLFPELLGNKFFITGESYAGKYIPAMAYTIHLRNPTSALKINLQGLAIGNGWSDPEHQLGYGEYLYQLGIIDWNQKKKFLDMEAEIVSYIKKKDWMKAVEHNRLMNMYVVYSGLDVYNYINPSDSEDFGPVLSTCSIRRDIHVGNLSFDSYSKKAYENLKNDMMQSVAPLITELLNHYDVLIYNGQLDVIVAYPLTVNYLRHLKFEGSEEYETAYRYLCLDQDDQVVGYMKKAGRLMEVMVRNAGHMVPADQPEWAFDIITYFTHKIDSRLRIFNVSLSKLT